MGNKGNEFKVGAMFIAGIALLVLIISTINRYGQEKGKYAFEIRFTQAQGILVGAQVRVSGITVGRVLSMRVDPDTNLALVKVIIPTNVILGKNYHYAVNMGALVGERYVEIIPTAKIDKEVEPNDIVNGYSPPVMDDLLVATGQLLTKLNETTTNLNVIIGDKSLQKSLKLTIHDLQQTANASAAFTQEMQRILARNGGAIEASLRNLESTTETASGFAKDARELVTSHKGDIAEMIANLKRTTGDAADFAGLLTQFMKDNREQFQEAVVDLRKTTLSAAEFSKGLNDVLNRNSNDLTETIGNLKKTTVASAELAGGLNSLLKEHREDMGSLMKDIRTSASNASEFTSTLNKMIKDNQNDLSASITDLRVTTKSAAEFANGLNKILTDNQSDIQGMISGIKKTTENSASLVANLDTIVKKQGPSLDAIISDMVVISSDMRKLSESITPQLTNSKIIPNLDEATKNVVLLSKRLDNAAASIESLAADKDIQQSLRDSVGNVKKAGDDLQKMMAEARTSMSILPEVATNIKDISANMKIASADIKSASNDLPGISQPFKAVAAESANNMLDISRSLKLASSDVTIAARQLARMGTFFEQLHIEPEGRLYRLKYALSSTSKNRADLGLKMYSQNLMLYTQINDVGQNNRLTFEFGNKLSSHSWLRYGLVEGKFGAGMEYNPSNNTRLAFDAYDPANIRGRATLDIRLKPFANQWWLTVGAFDIGDVNKRNYGAGLTYRP
jgi:ABC-type transporter Mla subunit MlaD